MTTNEPTPEKCIASRFPDDLSHPPVPSPETLEFPEQDAVIGGPSSTRLQLRGIQSGEITVDFLVGLHDLADDHDLSVESISVGHEWDE